MNFRINSLCRHFIVPSFVMTIIFVALAVDLQATIMKFMDVEDLAAVSTHIFRGEVLSMQTQWSEDHKSIYTSTRIRVSEAFKGPLSGGQVITVNQLGGEVDGVAMDYAGRPTFSVGENIVVFATQPRKGSFLVTALKQGKMQVEGETVVRDFSGITLVTRNSSSTNVTPIQKPTVRISINELRTRITRAR